MSTESIVKRLMESRLNEESKGFDYVFDIPWRETISYEDDEAYHYQLNNMDYADEIMTAAKEDFNESDLAKYARRDKRTEDCGIRKMTMDFNSRGYCEVTVTTSQILNDDQIEKVISYLEAQMSDGWGEGFEQREVATYKDESEEWVEDDEDEDGGYYDTVESTVYVYGQFWWSGDSRHPYQIELVRDPDEANESLEESETKRMEFSSESEAYEWAEDHGYRVDKIQNGRKDKACICYMSKSLHESEEDNDYDVVEDMKSQLSVLEKYIFSIIKEPIHLEVQDTDRGPKLISKEDYAEECGVMSSIYETVKLSSFNYSVREGKYWTTIKWMYKFKSGGSNGSDFISAFFNYPENPGAWTVRNDSTNEVIKL